MGDKTFIITQLGGGPGFTLKDTDLWGLDCALVYGIEHGYFKENLEWARNMREKIDKLRGLTDGT